MLFLSDLLHIIHDLPDKGAFSTLFQLFPYRNGVNIVETVNLRFGVEAVRFDKLGDPALDLRPGHIHLRTVHGNVKRLICPRVVFHGEPFRCFFIPCVHLHVSHDSLLALNVSVPGPDRVVYIVLGDLTLWDRCLLLRLPITKHTGPVRAIFPLMGVNGKFRLMVHREEGRHDTLAGLG